jgi:hypothetical protein
MEFFVPDDLVPKLRRNIHKTALANSRVDLDNGGASTARKNQLITRD